jgi:UDPglucose 6-dehydrogenase
MKSIGVIGRGFVGEAILQGMVHAFNVIYYDKYKAIHPRDRVGKHTREDRAYEIKEVLERTDGPIFLCLPTPMKKNGLADISIVEGVVKEINELTPHDEQKVLIIKSTVPPGTTEVFNARYENIKCVFNPEFLTERAAIEDFKNQDRIIIGGPHLAVSVVKQMYQVAYPNIATTKTSSTIAEMVKYTTNCFLATKVAFANEIYQICDGLGIDYDKLIEYATKDKRLGTSHWAVPGHDGHVGFGGTCLPKDLNALVSVAHNLGVDPSVMEAVWKKNLEIRPEKDWEQLKGRAVSE